MNSRLGVVLAGVTLLAPIPSAAGAQQSKWREEVTAQVDHAAKLLKERGYTKADIYDGSLDQDASESLTLPLRAGRQYAILGVCDVDCNNLDLRLYGGADRELDSDVEEDDVPVVMVTPEHDGKFRLKITMMKCESSPCFYGIGLFVK